MDIEEVRRFNLIKFPRRVGLEEGERLISYLAKNLPGTINYRASYFASLSGIEEDKSKRSGSVDIGCTVCILKPKAGVVIDSFCFGHSKDTSKLESIMFDMVPGWGVSNYDPKVKELWNDTRNLVKRYFERD